MKKLFLPVIILVLVLLTVGCGSKPSIVGSWENKEDAIVITFDKNGTGYTKMENNYYDSFIYTYKDGILKIKYQTIMETELSYKYEITEDTLEINIDNKKVIYKKIKD